MSAIMPTLDEYLAILSDCIEMEKQDLVNRNNGLPGDGTPKQIEIIIESLERLKKKLEADGFPPLEERFFEPTALIVRWAEWSTYDPSEQQKKLWNADTIFMGYGSSYTDLD